MTRVLLLADDPSIAKAAAVRLSEEDDIAVDVTSSVADVLERLARDRFDFVVVDRAEDSLADAKRIDAWLTARADPATVIVPTAAAFGLESVLASTAQHVGDLVAVVENAMQYRLSEVPARR